MLTKVEKIIENNRGETVGHIMKINISIPEDLLLEIEKVCKEIKSSRSGLVQKAVRKYLAFLAEEKKEQERRLGIERGIRLQDEVRSAIGRWDGTDELRKWRESRSG